MIIAVYCLVVDSIYTSFSAGICQVQWSLIPGRILFWPECDSSQAKHADLKQIRCLFYLLFLLDLDECHLLCDCITILVIMKSAC